MEYSHFIFIVIITFKMKKKRKRKVSTNSVNIGYAIPLGQMSLIFIERYAETNQLFSVGFQT